MTKRRGEMGILARRSIYRAGKFSRVMTLPAKLKMGKEATLAATRLLLVDPRGEIEPEVLLEFLESLEPRIWNWIENKRDSSSPRPQQE